MTDILDQVAYGRSFLRRDRHPSGLDTAMRLEPPPEAAIGYEDGFIASPECFVAVKRLVANRTFEDEARGLDRFLFLFHLSGQRTADITGFGKCRLQGPAFYVQYLPRGTLKTNTWTPGDHETVVSISFRADSMPKIVADVLGPHSMLRALDAEADGQPILLRCPLSLDMEQAARTMLLPTIHPALLPHLLATKANELLCLGLDSVLFALDSTRSGGGRLQSQIRHARQILERDIRNPPSVCALARMVRLSTDALTREFQRAYGMGVPEFLSHRRMKAAYHALVTTGTPLKKVSYDVGYGHTSNFCTAFKRHFGRTPSEVRQARGRDIDRDVLDTYRDLTPADDPVAGAGGADHPGRRRPEDRA